MLTSFPLASVQIDPGLMRPDQVDAGAEVSFRQVFGRLALDGFQGEANLVPTGRNEGEKLAPPPAEDGESRALHIAEPEAERAGVVVLPVAEQIIARPMPSLSGIAEPEQEPEPESVTGPLPAGSTPPADTTPFDAARPLASFETLPQTLVSPFKNTGGAADQAAPTITMPAGVPAESRLRHRTESTLSRTVLESRLRPATIATAPASPSAVTGTQARISPFDGESRALPPRSATISLTTIPQRARDFPQDWGLMPEIATGQRAMLQPADGPWVAAALGTPVLRPADIRGSPATALGEPRPSALARVAESSGILASHPRPDPIAVALPGGQADPVTPPLPEAARKIITAARGVNAPATARQGYLDFQASRQRPVAAPRDHGPSGPGIAAARIELASGMVSGVLPDTAPTPALARGLVVDAEREGGLARDVGQPDMPQAETARHDAPRHDPARLEFQRPVVAAVTTRQIAEAVPEMDGPGFDLALNPEELGQVRLRLTGVEGGSLLVIHAERPETLDLLRRHIAMLEQDLRDLGHEGLILRFSAGGGGAERGHPPPAEAGEMQDHPAVRPATARPGIVSPAGASRRLGTDHLDLRL